MSFLGIAFEMQAMDDGMQKGIDKAASLLSNVNSMLEDQYGRIKGIKKQNFFKGIENGVKRAGCEIKKVGISISGPFRSIIGESVERLGSAFKKVETGVTYLRDNVIKNFSKIQENIKKFGTKTVEKFGDSFASVSKKIKGVKNKVNSFMNSMQIRAQQFNIASIASNIKSLTGETGNLSNGLEATMVSYMQTTKPIAAQLNLTSSEMKKMSSRAAGIAYGMNTDAGAVIETMAQMKIASNEAKETLDKMGMSTKDWVKVVQTTNVEMKDYVSVIGDMRASWGASAEESKDLINNLVDIGKKANTGLMPLQGMKGYLGSLNELFQDLPPGMTKTSKEIKGMIESAGMLGGAFQKMGSTPEQAQEMAQGIGLFFAKQDTAIRKTLAIGGDPLSNNPLLIALQRLTGNFEEARGIIDIGSKDALAGMEMINDLYARFEGDKSTGTLKAFSDIQKALGEASPGVSYLVANLGIGTKAFEDMQKVSVDGSNALKKFGKDAYSSGLTLQDSYDRAKEAFDTTIRSIARSNVKGLVKKQMAGMREAGQELKAMAGDKTWGPWINAMSQFKQMGISGLMASFAESSGVGAKNAAKFGSKVGVVFDTISQFGDELAPLMQMFGMTGPLGPLLAAGGIGALFMMDDSAAKDILGPMFDQFKMLKTKATEIWDEWAPKFAEIWDGQIRPKIVGIWKNDVVPEIKNVWNSSVIPFLKESAPKIGGAFLDGLRWAWDEFGKVFGSGTQIAAGVAGGAAVAAKVGILGAVVGPVIGGIAKPLMSVFRSGGSIFLEVLKQPKVGLVALAGLAGAALGSAIGSKVVGERGVERAVKEAEDVQSRGVEFLINEDTISNDTSLLAKKIERIKAALAYEESTLWPDEEDVDRLKDALNIIGRQKQEYWSGIQDFNIQNSSVGTLAGGSYVMDPLEAEGYLLGGQTSGKQFVEGVSDALEKGKEKIDESIGYSAEGLMSHSPIQSGPLAGEAENNAAFRGGRQTMEQFADGIESSTDFVREVTERALDNSVIASMETYSERLKEWADQKPLFASVASEIARQLTGQNVQIETSVDAEADVNVKKNFQAAMNVPGLASVVLAVSNEGAMTRKLMKRQLDELVKQTAAMGYSGAPGRGGTYVPLPS